jgi:hypothetical protein
MTEHPDLGELEQFVLGELVGPALERFEAHVVACDACSARLAAEARLEVALVELASLPPAAQRGRLRTRLATGAAIAAAAGLLLVLIDVRRGEDAPRSIPGVVCAIAAEQTACVQAAHRHGLVVIYPDWAGAPPLGDRADGLRASGPSSPPFAAERVQP